MQIDRDEAVNLARRKMPVLVTGGNQPAREVRSLKELPGEPGDNYDGPPLEYHRLRDDHGNWTRAGMEHAIRSGGSVMHHGNVITRVEDLPDEAELAAGDQTRIDAEAARIDGEIAKLATQRSALQRQREDGEKAAQAAAAQARQRTEDRQGAQLKENMAQTGEKQAVTAGHPEQKAAPPAGRSKKE